MTRLLSNALLVLVVALAGTTAAQAQRQPDELPVQVDVDHATFVYSSDKTLLELYVAFGASSLNYEQRDGSFRADLPVRFALRRSTEEALPATPTDTVWSDSTTFQFALKDTTGLTAGQHFIQQVRQSIAPGEYELELTIPEATGGERQALTLRRDIKVPSYEEDGSAALSDLVLASSIKQSDNQQSPFYKNGLLIRPNANQLYGQDLPQLFYYAEAYQPNQLAGDSDQYTVYAYVARAGELKPVRENLKKRYEREARSPDVLVGSFNIATLPSGSYFLRLALLGEDNEAAAQQARKFFVFNPDVEREQASSLTMSFESSPFAALSTEETNTELKQIELIDNARSKSHIDDLDSLEQKQRYLMRFWQRRDPKPNTARNERRQRFMQQVQYANQRYSTNFAEGWNTDRGRALLQYGRPSEIEPHLYDKDKAPHEIWIYDNIRGEGRSRFVFADRKGYGRFELIHSTVSGETSMPNWEQILQQ